MVSLPASRVWDLLFASGLQERYEQGEITSREFYDAFCSRSATHPDYDTFHLANSQIFELNVPIVPIVGHLKAAGYPLGILSNTCESHWQHVSDGRFCVISSFFPTLVLSYQLRSQQARSGYLSRGGAARGSGTGQDFLCGRPPGER